MAKVRKGGRKKKLKQTMPTTDATIAGRDPQAVATNRMIKRKARATVVGLMCSPKSFRAPDAAAMQTRAAAYPNQALLSTVGFIWRPAGLFERSSIRAPRRIDRG